MRPLSIALAIPPQSCEGRREPGWRLGRGEGLAEFVKGHHRAAFLFQTEHIKEMIFEEGSPLWQFQS